MKGALSTLVIGLSLFMGAIFGDVAHIKAETNFKGWFDYSLHCRFHQRDCNWDQRYSLVVDFAKSSSGVVGHYTMQHPAENTFFDGIFTNLRYEGQRNGFETIRGRWIDRFGEGDAFFHSQNAWKEVTGELYFGSKKGNQVFLKSKSDFNVVRAWIAQYPSAGLSRDSLYPVLKTLFSNLPQEERKRIQENLKFLGLYKPLIDGNYGIDTELALIEYSKEHQIADDLRRSENASKVITSVLGFAGRSQPGSDEKLDKIYKVSSGSGFYVSDDGHIITNHHVVEGCQDTKVHLKGNVLEAKQIATDRRNDLALLKIVEKPGYAFALSAESPFPLQEVIVAGYPFGERVSSNIKFTQGVVSAVAGLGNDYSQIQIDAAIQPGNSGGPIIDQDGNVVGVAVAKLSLKRILKDYGVVPENTNFGVKASAVRNLLEGNKIPIKPPNKTKISKRQLSSLATEGTVFLSCWMNVAQIAKYKTHKVLFNNFK